MELSIHQNIHIFHKRIMVYLFPGISRVQPNRLGGILFLALPARATKGSAGYDFHAPFAFSLPPGGSIRIPTGIRVRIEDGWVLKLYPRSGLGFKYRLR